MIQAEQLNRIEQLIVDQNSILTEIRERIDADRAGAADCFLIALSGNLRSMIEIVDEALAADDQQA